MASSDKKILRIPMKDHLRNSPQPTDVSFVFHVVQGKGTEQKKHDVVFPAHRWLLAAWPYFESLQAGDWKHADEVSMEDCQAGAFRILLRWTYDDEAVLDSICPSTFIGVLLAADRFGIKDLVCRLVGLAEQLLTMDLFRKILDVLEHRLTECANELNRKCLVYIDKLLTLDHFYGTLNMVERRQIACASELSEKCLKCFDKNAAALVKHSSFTNISHEQLMLIMAKDSLCLREIDLYRAAIK